MNIYLNVQTLKNDIQAKHIQELNTSELIPSGVITLAMNEAYALLKGVCAEYLSPVFDNDAYDTLSSSESLTLNLSLSSRRAGGKTQALADLMHSYVVNATLSKIYANNANLENAKMHNELLASDGAAITHLLHTKLPPRL